MYTHADYARLLAAAAAVRKCDTLIRLLLDECLRTVHTSKQFPLCWRVFVSEMENMRIQSPPPPALQNDFNTNSEMHLHATTQANPITIKRPFDAGVYLQLMCV